MLTLDQKQFYADNGYLVLDNIYTEEEINDCIRDYDELFQRKSHQDLEALWGGDWKQKMSENPNKTSVKSIHNLQYHSATFTRMLLNKKMADAVSELTGNENLLLHHTKAHIKPPEKGAPFPMHQDYHYFPYRDDSMVAVFIHLDDSDPENGGLAVFPGSHKLGPLENKSNTPGFYYIDQDQFPIQKATPLKAKKGDVAIFSYLLIHGSYLNTSSRVRRMLLFQLMSAEDEPTSDLHKSVGQGLVLRGFNAKMSADLKARFPGAQKGHNN